MKLEAQVCELGEYNKDLSTQLRKELIERMEEDEDLQLESKLVEPELVEPRMHDTENDQFDRPEG